MLKVASGMRGRPVGRPATHRCFVRYELCLASTPVVGDLHPMPEGHRQGQGGMGAWSK